MSGDLAAQQAALVRALVARGSVPDGFDAGRVDAAARALLRKRAGEVAAHWPVLMSDPATRARFVDWADGRPKTSSFDDGLAFAIDQRGRGGLSKAALSELRHNRKRGLLSRWRAHAPG